MKRVFITVSNDLATDQRVQRVARMLAEQGLAVCCLGRRLPRSKGDPSQSPPFSPEEYAIRRFRLPFNHGPQFYAALNIRLFIYLMLRRRPGLIIANDLDTLPAAGMVSRWRSIPLVYDSHELFTELPELVHRPRTRKIWKRIEQRYLPGINHAITVSPSIARYYEAQYGVVFRVVRNVPLKRAPEDIRTERDGQTIIYQGALNLGRGLDLMVRAMLHVPEGRLILAGSGDVEQELLSLVSELGLDGRVEFTGRLSPDHLRELTCRASLGLSLEEDLGLNYRYALPNKLFDYIQCGLPCICSDLPEMKALVEGYGVGKVLEERSPEALAALIKEMLGSSSGGTWREALDSAARELCWEGESLVYLEVVEQAMGKR